MTPGEIGRVEGSIIKRILSLDESPEAVALAERSYRKLHAQIPLMYGIAIACLLGVHITLGQFSLFSVNFANLLTLLLVWRMLFWLLIYKPRDHIKEVQNRLKVAALFTALISLGFTVWAQMLFSEHPDLATAITLHFVLAAIGAAYGLISFPIAATLPILILGVPISVRLFILNDGAHVGAGVSLLVAFAILLRLIYLHYGSLRALVRNRLAADAARRRAIEAENVALKRSRTDALTGLANRGHLADFLEKVIDEKREGFERCVLMLLDLDGFKSANDAFGHAAGDAILVEIASRLEKKFGSIAIVARMGGDEIALFFPSGVGEERVGKLADEAVEIVQQPISWKDKFLKVGVSCGVTEYGAETSSSTEFLRQADSALYHAKAHGEGSWLLYSYELFKRDMRRRSVERRISNGEAADEIQAVFQPVLNLRSGTIDFHESLARWDAPGLGEVSPQEFISAAEQLGEITALNEKIFETTLASFGAVQPCGKLSFNLSAAQLNLPGAAESVIKLTKNAGLSLDQIIIEMTETAFISNFDLASEQMLAMQEAGIKLALDDFGAGNASIGYLCRFQFDFVKLDGSLIDGVDKNAKRRNLVKGLIELSHAHDAACVAEHVETQGQLMTLMEIGCDFAQGFAIGDPCRLDSGPGSRKFPLAISTSDESSIDLSRASGF